MRIPTRTPMSFASAPRTTSSACSSTPTTRFSIPELVDATGVTRSTVWRAVDLLDSIDAIQIRETPQRNYIAINPDRLQKDDPILGISQSEFHAPIRAFVDRVQATTADADDINDLLGIVIFGSVARGRQTDRAISIASWSSMATGRQPAGR